jgi:hypothetical protein
MLQAAKRLVMPAKRLANKKIEKILIDFIVLRFLGFDVKKWFGYKKGGQVGKWASGQVGRWASWF